jgi:hypothetical protein
VHVVSDGMGIVIMAIGSIVFCMCVCVSGLCMCVCVNLVNVMCGDVMGLCEKWTEERDPGRL